MARVVDDLIEAADDEYGAGLVTMLRGEDFAGALVDEAVLPGADPARLPHRQVLAAEWRPEPGRGEAGRSSLWCAVRRKR